MPARAEGLYLCTSANSKTQALNRAGYSLAKKEKRIKRIDEAEKLLIEQGLKTKRAMPDRVDLLCQSPDAQGYTDMGWLSFYQNGSPDAAFLAAWGNRELCIKLAAILLDGGFETITLDNEQPCGGGEW